MTGEFDAVFSNAALHWIPEAEKVIRGVARALKSNGRFVAEMGGKGNIRRLVEAITVACREVGLDSGAATEAWYYPSIGEYSGLLEKHGIEVRQAALFDRPTRLEDGEKGLEAWLRMFRRVILDRLPAAAQDAFLREVERQARPELFKDGVWELEYRRLRIVAWKQAVRDGCGGTATLGCVLKAHRQECLCHLNRASPGICISFSKRTPTRVTLPDNIG